MFHMAYLVGSYIAVNFVLEDPFEKQEGSEDVLLQLNLAHVFTPIFTGLSIIANSKKYHVLEKIFDTISIFQYQGTIFYAQYFQMNSNPESKLTGINTWFIIEILSFYGYILSAIAFIGENAIKSSLGWLDKSHMKERYKQDFVAYHRLDLDWLAFVTILFNVNVGLIAIDELIVFNDVEESEMQKKEFPLKPLVYQLLVNHLLQMIFLRNFYDENRRVNTKHRWVWYFHIVSYSYIIYVYYFTDARFKDASESSKIWIPLDIILTFNISMY